MKKLSTILFSLLFCVISSNAAIYLISSNAIKEWASIKHNGHWFTIGVNAFPDFESFCQANIEENSTVYVADGTYSDNITISTKGLTILRQQCF